MSKLSREDVLKLARLSRLRLSEDEIKNLQTELSEILTYVEQLDKVDVDGLTPTYQVTGLKNVARPDEVVNYQAKPEQLLKNAPAIEKNQFKVKRVL
jgi:aspartyl-tRNA(Asn)/glutamyl-tRNA(Gln) amidotransferase subunit C